MRKSFHCACAVMALVQAQALLSPVAAASEWRVDQEASSIAFTFTQMAAPIEGAFQRFSSEITFDPDDLSAASVETVIEIDSVSTGNADRDAGIRSKDWFDSAGFPHATFTSTRFEAKGGDLYDVSGSLTIRGESIDVLLPMTIVIDGDGATAQGTIELDRRDFGLGQGDWAVDKVIGYPVGVELFIEAARGSE